LDLPDIPESILQNEFSEFSEQVQPFLPTWLPNFKFRTPDAERRLPTAFDIDVHQMVIQYELKNRVPWPIEKLEAFRETAEVIFDRQGLVRDLIAQKISQGLSWLKGCAVRTLASVPVRIGVDVDRCVGRGQIEEANLVITLAILDLLSAVYSLNDRFPPNPKWIFYGLEKLRWKPSQAFQRFTAALQNLGPEEKHIRRRVELTRTLLADIERRYREIPGAKDDVYTWASTRLFPDRQLRHVTTADEIVGANIDQYAKMTFENWRTANWELRKSG
jgi:hypothetical protein